MAAVSLTLLHSRTMRAHTSTVVVLRVRTDPSLTSGYLHILLMFFKAIFIGPELDMWSMLVHLFFTTLFHYKVDSPWSVSFSRNSVLYFLLHHFNKSLNPPLTPAMCIYRPHQFTHQTLWFCFVYVRHKQFSCQCLNSIIRTAEKKKLNFWHCSPRIHRQITLKLFIPCSCKAQTNIWKLICKWNSKAWKSKPHSTKTFHIWVWRSRGEGSLVASQILKGNASSSIVKACM